MDCRCLQRVCMGLPPTNLPSTSAGSSTPISVTLDNVTNLSKVCRLCATITDLVIPIFYGEGEQNNLADKIHQHLPIKVSETDELPSVVCCQCASTLLAWHELVKCSVQAEQALKAKIAVMQQTVKKETKAMVSPNCPNRSSSADEDSKSKPESNFECSPATYLLLQRPVPSVPYLNSPFRQCQYCGKTMLRDKYSKHIMNHHLDQVWLCQYCEEYVDRRFYYMHSNEHGAAAQEIIRQQSCQYCNPKLRKPNVKKENDNQNNNIVTKTELTTAAPVLPAASETVAAVLLAASGTVAAVPLAAPETVAAVLLGAPATVAAVPLGAPATVAAVPLGAPATVAAVTLGAPASVAAVPLGAPATVAAVPLAAPKTVAAGPLGAPATVAAVPLAAPKTVAAVPLAAPKTVVAVPLAAPETATHVPLAPTPVPSEGADAKRQTAAAKDTKRARNHQENDFSDHSVDGFGPLPNSVFDAIEDTQDSSPAESDQTAVNDTSAGPGESITPTEDIDPTKCNKKSRTCPICFKVYTASSSFFYHMKHTHKRIKEHECEICSKLFATRASLSSHMATHSDERRFECKKCNKRFRSNASLYIHEQTHNGVKTWSCSQCKSSFRWKTHLQRHMQRHSAAKAHVCSTCGRGFSIHCDLLRHARTHQGGNLSCDKCKVKFAQQRYLKVHMEKKHGRKTGKKTNTHTN